MKEIQQNPEVLKAPQAPALWELVLALKKAAAGTSTEFWVWWWGLPKAHRLLLLEAEGATEKAVA